MPWPQDIYFNATVYFGKLLEKWLRNMKYTLNTADMIFCSGLIAIIKCRFTLLFYTTETIVENAKLLMVNLSFGYNEQCSKELYKTRD